jgi:hypothetical protein
MRPPPEDIYAFLASLDSGFVGYVESIVTDPTLDVHRHKEPVMMETSSKIPAIDSGETTALLLARPDSLVADVDGRKTKDTIHHLYAPIKKIVYPNDPMPTVDPNRFADRLYRYCHSHGETTANLLYPANEPMRAIDPSRLADRQYRNHHSHGESSTKASLIQVCLLEVD